MLLRKLKGFAGARIASVKRDRRAFLCCLLALLLVSAIDAAILAVRRGPNHKIGPNQIRCPWKVADPPPQCLPRSAVVVVKPEAASKAAAPTSSQTKRVQRAAFAPFGPLRTEN